MKMQNVARLIVFLCMMISVISAEKSTLFNFDDPSKIHDQKRRLGGKKILILYWNPAVGLVSAKKEKISAVSKRLRGSAVYKINLYKKLIEHGFNVSLFVVNDEAVLREATELGLPCAGCQVTGQHRDVLNGIYKQLFAVCAREKVAIIHGHATDDAKIATWIAKRLPVKVVITKHTDNHCGGDWMRGIDGVVCVGTESERKVTKANEEQKLGIKNIMWLAPFFDETRFLNFVPKMSRQEFFQKEFGVTLHDGPVICCVSNFYYKFKNHTVLLRAMHSLIHDYNIPVQLVLAGMGARFDEMQQLAKQLKIDAHVHFLGHTTKTPEIYYYSDINALTSNQEAFGIVLLEGALLKKPLLGTRHTGMEAVVLHEKTGLLFEKGNVHDLAKQLARLIADQQLRQTLGQNAYNLVANHFLTKQGIKQLEKFYASLL